VDCANLSGYLSSLDRFKDIFTDGLDDSEEAEGEGEKSISQLMMEQVEFANVILLNKIDLVSKKQLQVTKKLVKQLNPKARIIEGSYGKVDLLNILNTNLFNMEEASESPGWLVSLKEGVNAAHGEDEEYGVSSFVYRARKPFHPLRLHHFIKELFCYAEDWAVSAEEAKKNIKPEHKEYGAILRSKGTCWIAGRDQHVISWAQAGRILNLDPEAAWHCTIPEEEWGLDTEEEHLAIKERFMGEYGDRCQEIVFIGTNLNQLAVKERLTKCLLTDAEMHDYTASLPMGTYPDPLTPNGLTATGSQSLFYIARQGQNQHLRVAPGNVVTLQNFAVTFNSEQDEKCIRSVKIWLDKSDATKQGVLVATLRPEKCEQYSTKLSILPCEDEQFGDHTFRRIRVEIVPRQGIKKSQEEWLTSCEVHVLGVVEPLSNDKEEGPATDNVGEDEEHIQDTCSM